ncbi:glycoside hydrolase family 2 TIM barrel-domain containing protein [Pedobacter sp. KR3-3]|uniref:Glycoside hydrolase family 2 TIM barrel-domain containing protein n=1 Tax=Pedobacter albus TaxID=3113905 RepID=A0ABU7I4Y3_9SPHI|nr:glycoside hydrolase family 2 TIM barrel-domain containing protein [Pedobacter sp. KR3-3]MEE1944483.1 glycoside hydrolase family 2 TIM barrel-domain containing protein [Pedobacter sp. KR3-3]
MRQSTRSRIYCLVLLLASCFTVFAQAQSSKKETRQYINLNANWSFAKDPGRQATAGNWGNLKWATVNVPHTWNAFDVMDDEPGYYRGIGWYKKKLSFKPEWKNKKLALYFEGANQETAVYLNGKKIGSHIGGYTAFTVPLTNLKFNGTDEIAVKVDNAYNESIAPLTADFTFFGGLYRKVSLLVADAVHFQDDQYATKGVYIHANKVSASGAEVIINGNLSNATAVQKKLNLVSTLLDANGKKIAVTQTTVVANAKQDLSFALPAISVKNPNLWSPEKPYLYKAMTSIVDAKTGQTIDEVTTNVGLRFFSFDANTGFSLNGKAVKLIGASRHQDFAGMGNAVPSSLQVKDVELLKSMGGNFLRVAHYPQDQAVLDACDRLGILTSVEIPIVNEITETEAFTRNCKNMQVEMIKQNYNHPSIIIWAYMNEVLLRMKFNNDQPRKQQYLENIATLAQQLEDLTRATDPTRYTMMSNHGDVNGYTKAGLVKIPMIVGWNLYQGWYGGKSEDFGPNLDKIHQQIPDKPIIITEYGADVDPRIHAFTPIRFDKSLEYGMLYHQIYIGAIMSRSFVAGAAAWNLSDFNSETRDETMPHVNNKGLLTLARQPKNTYYLYKAHFNQQPFLKIGDGSWTIRGGVAPANSSTLTQLLQVISNTDSVTLFVNGKSLGTQAVKDRLSNWEVPFKNGINEIRAVAMYQGKKLEDRTSIRFVLQPDVFAQQHLAFKAINICLGSQRQFIDFQQKEIWLPSQAYKPGSWGSIGGEPFKIKNSGRQAYGSDKNIRGTFNDPVYQTQLVGLDGYQLDVPKGKYEVVLHFAELMGNGIQSVLPYNLDSLIEASKSANKEVPEQRIFDVYLNDKLIIKNLNLASTYGIANSVQKKFECMVADDKGIRLTFKSVKGKPVLNALQVKRID